MPEIDRTLVLGGVLALACGFYLLRWGGRLAQALWRRLNVRRGVPYLRSSISSYASLTAVALLGVAAGFFLVATSLILARVGRLEGESAEVGRLTVESRSGELALRLEPAPGTPFLPFEASLPGERWRLTGWVTRFSGLWRALGLRDAYRPALAEVATGPRGRPADWKVSSRPLQPPDPWLERWEGLVRRLPGVRRTPHATDWEQAAPSVVLDLIVVPDGYALVGVEAAEP